MIEPKSIKGTVFIVTEHGDTSMAGTVVGVAEDIETARSIASSRAELLGVDGIVSDEVFCSSGLDILTGGRACIGGRTIEVYYSVAEYQVWGSEANKPKAA